MSPKDRDKADHDQYAAPLTPMNGPIDQSQLEDVVARMRKLGVTKFGDIELGPDPNASPEDDRGENQRTAEAEHRAKERKRVLTFGASGGPRPRAALK